MKSPARPANQANKVPISAHPAFPAIVALWFAALLGIGCLVLPPALVENAMSSVGLSLGFGGRAIFAAFTAIVGGITGFVLGRRIADSYANAPSANTGRNFAPAPRTPFNPQEVLEQAESENPGLRSSRRRSLAMEEDKRESDFLITVPLPGEEIAPPVAGKSQADQQAEQQADEMPVLEVATLLPEPQENEEISASAEPAEPEIAVIETVADNHEPAAAMQEPETLPEFEERLAPETPEAQAADTSAEDLSFAANNAANEQTDDLEPRPFDQPLVFNPPSLARHKDEAEAEVADEFANEDAQGQRFEPRVELVSEAEPDDISHGDWVDASLDQLGLVQLVQRLGHSLERRRELVAQAAVVEAPAPHAEPVFHAGIDAAPAEEATQAMAAFFSRQQLVHDEPEDEAEEELSTSFNLPLGRSEPLALSEVQQDNPAVANYSETEFFGDTADDDEELLEDQDETEMDEDFGSLVEMKNPFRYQEPEFVRVEEPDDEDDGFIPAVIFPNQETQQGRAGISSQTEPETPVEQETSSRLFDPPAGAASTVPPQTDDALREAIAKLQRVNGAA